MSVQITTIAAAIASVSLAGAALAQPGPADGAGRGAVRKACEADLQQLCANVEPGGGRIVQCLRDHADRVSAPCKSAISEARGGRGRRQDQTPPAPPSSQPSPN